MFSSSLACLRTESSFLVSDAPQDLGTHFLSCSIYDDFVHLLAAPGPLPAGRDQTLLHPTWLLSRPLSLCLRGMDSTIHVPIFARRTPKILPLSGPSLYALSPGSAEWVGARPLLPFWPERTPGHLWAFLMQSVSPFWVGL